jgi:hypothetical protein
VRGARAVPRNGADALVEPEWRLKVPPGQSCSPTYFGALKGSLTFSLANLDEADRAQGACRCAWCDGCPRLVHAKADAEVIGVRPVLDLPKVSLLVNAEVVKLGTDPSRGRVTGIMVERCGNRDVYSADIVAFCAVASNGDLERV